MRLVLISQTTLKLCCSQAGYHQPEFQIYFNVISDCCHSYLFATTRRQMIFRKFYIPASAQQKGQPD
ncbi:hypothetical protein T03_3555 [Trichinella britovi]|uniref:Uncharacterized protein n=1 Tax=Trichinella britovi TaxID=45882 RepID=A0A0V1ALH1_TRIBR|nr:hypothetical protein T03_3555 [Trichinella britovi]